MKLKVEFQEINQDFDVVFNDTDASFNTDFNEVNVIEVPTNNDYTKLVNKPQIEEVTLEGNKSFIDLGLEELSNTEILEIAKKFLGGD